MTYPYNTGGSSSYWCYKCMAMVALPHQCPNVTITFPNYPPATTTTTNWLLDRVIPAIDPSAETTLAALRALQTALLELLAGEHAGKSRDFGRGVAYAARLITDAVTTALETP